MHSKPAIIDELLPYMNPTDSARQDQKSDKTK
jgi:hypothetical protein